MHTDPVGTIRRHFEMVAVKQANERWVIVYPDGEYVETSQRLEDINDKWPVIWLAEVSA